MRVSERVLRPMTANNDELIARSFLSDSSWSFVSSAIIKGMSLISTIAVARILGKDEYGIYGTLLSLINMVSVLGNLGITNAVAKYLPEYKILNQTRMKSVIWTSTVITLIISLANLAVVLSFADYLASVVYRSPRIRAYIIFAGILIVTYLIINLGSSFLQGLRLYKDLAVRNLYLAIVTVPLTIVLVKYFGIPGVIAGSILVNLYNLYLIHRILRGFFKDSGIGRNCSFDFYLARELLRYSLPVFLGGLFSLPVPWIGNTLLATQKGFGEVGLFTAATNLAMQVAFLTTAINFPLVPLYTELLAAGNRKALKNLFIKNIKMTWLLTLTIALFMGLNAHWIIRLLYGADYSNSELILFWMAVSVMISSVNNVIGMLILASGKVWISFLVNSIWAVVAVLWMFMLIPLLGGVGVALSYVLAYLGHSFVQVYITRKVFSIQVWDWRLFATTLLLLVTPLVVELQSLIYSNLSFVLFTLVIWVLNVNTAEKKLILAFAKNGSHSAYNMLLKQHNR